MSAVCEPVADRISTYRVSTCDVLLGWVRYDIATLEWVSRTPGDADGKSSSTVRRFGDKVAAIAWLAESEPAPAEPGRSPYAAPARRRAAA
jgi:hypothetical protein